MDRDASMPNKLHLRIDGYVKCGSRSVLDSMEEIVLGKLKCQVARPFMSNRKTSDSSGCGRPTVVSIVACNLALSLT